MTCRVCQTFIVMDYMVVGADGKEYGPVDIATLAEWAKTDRVRPNSTVKEFPSGRAMPASLVPGLFQPLAGPAQGPGQNWSQLPSYYRQPQAPRSMSAGGGNTALIWSFVEAAAAVLLFFFLRGIGLIFAAGAIINGFRAHSAGHKAAPIAIAVAILAFVAVAIGWVVRLSGSVPGY